MNKERINELVDATTRDDIGSPIHGIGKATMKYTCPQCGYETIGTADKVEVICPTCKVPLLTKREEDMETKDLEQSISTNVSRLKAIIEELEDKDEGKKKSKKEQDDDVEDDDKVKKDKEDDKDDEDDDEMEKKEKKSKKNEQNDGELEKLPYKDPDKDDTGKDSTKVPDDKASTDNGVVKASGSVDISALIDFLGKNTGLSFDVVNTVFDSNGNKLSITVSQDIPEDDSLKSKLADIFGTNLANVNISKATIEVKNLKIKIPESKDKNGSFGITTKDMAGLKVHFVTAEGDEVDKLVCPVGTVEQDGKCVPKEAVESKKEDLKRTFRILRNLI